jgi:hypothetical protein
LNNIRRIRAPSAPTPMEADNTTATGYSNGTIKQKTHKSNGYAFLLDKNRAKQGPFNVYWGPSYQNLADYFKKHHLPGHHKRMREIYMHADEQQINWKGTRDSALRGCANTSGKAGALHGCVQPVTHSQLSMHNI